ncbi:MAG: helix-turn-helix transcriptional regulator [Deltaproteobacteria bacterium]|nr:helix-turn-helix transcriptional regulator [Deltaproteobacteria bacterium]
MAKKQTKEGRLLRYSGAALQKARKAKGLSQADLAYLLFQHGLVKKVGSAEVQICRWEKDENPPRGDMLIVLQQILDASLMG